MKINLNSIVELSFKVAHVGAALLKHLPRVHSWLNGIFRHATAPQHFGIVIVEVEDLPTPGPDHSRLGRHVVGVLAIVLAT